MGVMSGTVDLMQRAYPGTEIRDGVLRTLVGEVAGGRVDQRTSQTGRPLVRGN
jgi:hypothetical protein